MKIKRNVLLAPLCTFRIGNKAEYFCPVKNEDELIEVMRWAKDRKISWKIFAGGSNIVFPDGRLQGLLIRIGGGTIRTNGRIVTVDAGVPLAAVIKKSISSRLAGLETLSGIPGTVGGAIVGNAGAYGHSISEVVEKVEILDEKLKRKWFTKAQCKFAYRESIFKRKPFIVLRAVLKFTPLEISRPKVAAATAKRQGGFLTGLKKERIRELRKISRDIIKIRLKKYKPGLKCPGSFFKNIPVKEVSKKSLKLIPRLKIIEGKIPAGYLLEQVGAKGMRVGGIEIAKFHGNLFINRGHAKARDVKKLAKILKQRVYKKFGIKLEEEIRYF